jgi:hypothetical protein
MRGQQMEGEMRRLGMHRRISQTKTLMMVEALIVVKMAVEEVASLRLFPQPTCSAGFKWRNLSNDMCGCSNTQNIEL